MDQFPKMLYKVGSQVETNNGRFDTEIARDEDHEAELIAAGFFASMPDALAEALKPKDPPKDDDMPPTRAEMEVKAKELNIAFDGRTTDAKLLEKINEALKPKA